MARIRSDSGRFASRKIEARLGVRVLANGPQQVGPASQGHGIDPDEGIRHDEPRLLPAVILGVKKGKSAGGRKQARVIWLRGSHHLPEPRRHGPLMGSQDLRSTETSPGDAVRSLSLR